MKSVISAQRMLIAEMKKTDKNNRMVEYWENQVRERSKTLEDHLVKQRKIEERQIEFIKEG